MTETAWLSAADQLSLTTVGECADALAAALIAPRADAIASTDPPRTLLPLSAGQLIVMPSAATGNIGVKLVTVTDSRTSEEIPRIQGVHVQFDRVTLAPRAILDGIALTNTRTAAVSVLALRSLAGTDSSTLIVFGSGPQAHTHIRAICAEWPIRHVHVASRRVESARRLVDLLRDVIDGVDISALTPSEMPVADADIIVCATTANTPVFSEAPNDNAVVVGVGSHTPTQRELPGDLFQRAYVVVENRETALREAGDVILAIEEGAMREEDIRADLGELVRGATVDHTRPRVFKSVGMAWQDAVVAEAILSRSS